MTVKCNEDKSIQHPCRIVLPENRGESGRSMVEMLGTLAIIGVLSIGSIAGYSYGMDKYRANTVMNDIMLRAVDVIAQFDRTGDANIDSWPTTTAGGYTIGLENDTVGIQVSGLPERLCKMLFDGMINTATVKIGAIEYDTATDDDICGEVNTMVFYVDEGGVAGGGGDEEDQIEVETTTTTIKQCDADSDCGDERCARCVDGVCDTASLDGTICVPSIGAFCKSGECSYDCRWTGWLEGSDLGDICFESRGGKLAETKCRVDGVENGADCLTNTAREVNFYCCMPNRNPIFSDDSIIPEDCYTNDPLYELDSSQCSNVCLNREMYNGSCVLKCPNGFRDYFGYCYSCSAEDTIEVDPSECAKCSNRESYATPGNYGCRIKS